MIDNSISKQQNQFPLTSTDDNLGDLSNKLDEQMISGQKVEYQIEFPRSDNNRHLNQSYFKIDDLISQIRELQKKSLIKQLSFLCSISTIFIFFGFYYKNMWAVTFSISLIFFLINELVSSLSLYNSIIFNRKKQNYILLGIFTFICTLFALITLIMGNILKHEFTIMFCSAVSGNSLAFIVNQIFFKMYMFKNLKEQFSKSQDGQYQYNNRIFDNKTIAYFLLYIVSSIIILVIGLVVTFYVFTIGAAVTFLIIPYDHHSLIQLKFQQYFIGKHAKKVVFFMYLFLCFAFLVFRKNQWNCLNNSSFCRSNLYFQGLSSFCMALAIFVLNYKSFKNQIKTVYNI